MSNNRLQVILNHLKQPVMKNVSTKKYKFTLDNDILSEAQRDFYEENGYIIIRKLISDDLLEEFKQRFLDLCNGTVPKGKMSLMADISLRKTNAKGENLYYKAPDVIWDDVFSKYICNEKLLDYVQCFTGPDIKVVHSMFINKPPDIGTLSSSHPIHQDLFYFSFRPADRIVASWTAVEDKITKENGCLYVIPGTHEAALQPHVAPKSIVNRSLFEIPGFNKAPVVPLPMEKGDTLFFHPKIFHGAYPNFTKGFRKCLSSHFASSHCKFIDINGTIQEPVGKEIVEDMKMRFGCSELTFNDQFRMRMRLVRGVHGSLI